MQQHFYSPYLSHFWIFQEVSMATSHESIKTISSNFVHYLTQHLMTTSLLVRNAEHITVLSSVLQPSVQFDVSTFFCLVQENYWKVKILLEKDLLLIEDFLNLLIPVGPI